MVTLQRVFQYHVINSVLSVNQTFSSESKGHKLLTIKILKEKDEDYFFIFFTFLYFFTSCRDNGTGTIRRDIRPHFKVKKLTLDFFINFQQNEI